MMKAKITKHLIEKTATMAKMMGQQSIKYAKYIDEGDNGDGDDDTDDEIVSDGRGNGNDNDGDDGINAYGSDACAENNDEINGN